MDKINYQDGTDMWKENWDTMSQGIIDEFKKTVISVLDNEAKVAGGILYGWDVSASGDKVLISHSSSTGVVVVKNGQLIYSDESSLVPLADSSVGIVNVIAVKYRELEGHPQYNQIHDIYQNIRIYDSYQIDAYTLAQWIALSTIEKDKYVVLCYATGTGAGNPPTINTNVRIYIGARIKLQSITEDMLSPLFRIYQTVVRNSQVYDDNFVGAKTDLEDDLNELRTKIKEIQGTASYTDPAPGNLYNFDDDLNHLHGEGVFENTWNEFYLYTSTGFVIYIDTGKGLVNKKVVRIESLATLTIDPSSTFTIGNWATKTDFEVAHFGVQPDTQSLAHNDLVNGTVHVTETDNTILVEGMDYTVDYDNGTITSIIGGNIANENIRFYYDYSLPRIDIVQIKDDSTLNIKKGTPQDSPIEPSADSENIKLWGVRVNENTPSISGTDIIDRRYFLDFVQNVVRQVKLKNRTIDPTLSELDCIYRNETTDRWEKANFTNLPRGVLTDINLINTSTGEVFLMGEKQNVVGLTPGNVYYMDSNGDLTTTYSHVKVGFMTSIGFLVDIDYEKELIDLEMDNVYKEFSFSEDRKLEITLTSLWNKYFIRNTWIASGNLNTAREYLAGSGTQNSALSFGGWIGAVSAVTEKFNGSTWTTSGNLNTARHYLAGSGIQNAALSFGGWIVTISNITEKFNGSAWTASGNLNTARRLLAGCGTQNASLSFGGWILAVSAVTEKFNGSAWTASGNLNTARYSLAGAGTQNAALSFGGRIGAVSAVTEKFNGSTWTTSGNLNTAREYLAGSGTQNSALSFGGWILAVSAVTEKFNGSAWTASGNLNTARYSLAGAGTQNAALSFGGNGPSNITEKFIGEPPFELYGIAKNEDDEYVEYITDEHYSFNITSPSILTCELRLKHNTGISDLEKMHIVELERIDYGDGVWTASGNLNTARYGLAGAGTQNSALSFGGFTGAHSSITEKFNGSSWTPSGNLNTARTYLAGSGIQNSALSFGGTVFSVVTEKFNGSSWTSLGNLNIARDDLAGSGTQNSALSFGGEKAGPAYADETEKFNGSSWTPSGNLNTARTYLAGSGIQNSALSFGGFTGAYSTVTEKFNGSAWSNTENLNTANSSLAGAGTQNSALSFGGFTGAHSSITEKFNNSVWTVTSNLNTSRRYLAGCGTQSSALSFGGYIAAVSAVTEKFNTELTLPFSGLVLANLIYK